MKRIMIKMIILVFLGFYSIQVFPQTVPDLIITNGKIFTVSEENPEVQALAIKDGKIITIGSTKEIEKLAGDKTYVLDVDKKLVLPGFIDAHCHFSSGGKSLSRLDLTNAVSQDFIQKQIAQKIKELPDSAAVFGYASFPNPGLFGGLGWPTKEILDKVSPNNPVVMFRRGGHAVWLNSAALKKSKITNDSETQDGGEIVFDENTGEPTGILKEKAQNLLKVWDPSTPKEDILRALEHAAKLGITGIQTGSNLREIDIYKQLYDEGKLTLRVSAWLPVGGLDEYIKKEIQQGPINDMIRIGLIKMFIDGTIGVRSALMFEPFAEDPNNTGLAQFEEDEFYGLVEKAHKNDYQVGVHAIGDKGVHWVLNAIELAQQKYGKKGLRHRVEHNTVNQLSDTKRFKTLGVVASMQPNITGGELYRITRLGAKRARRVDMWRTLLNNGVMLAWGTDWPVSNLNPMFNIYQVVTRYYPEQRLTMAEAIKYYTLGSAYASFDEESRGTLEVGKFADMVVLSQDLFRIDPKEITKTEVLYTIVDGKIAYQKSSSEEN